MATLASTNVTGTIARDGGKPLSYGNSGLVFEVFRVASGGAAADTVALTPQYISDIGLVLPNVSASDNISTTAANTNVTLTLASGTSTIGAFQVTVVGTQS